MLSGGVRSFNLTTHNACHQATTARRRMDMRSLPVQRHYTTRAMVVMADALAVADPRHGILQQQQQQQQTPLPSHIDLEQPVTLETNRETSGSIVHFWHPQDRRSGSQANPICLTEDDSQPPPSSAPDSQRTLAVAVRAPRKHCTPNRLLAASPAGLELPTSDCEEAHPQLDGGLRASPPPSPTFKRPKGKVFTRC